MTDIPTAAPITIRRFKLPRLGFPKVAIGATLNDIFGGMGDALKMAYVNPYTSHGRRPQVGADDDLDGRDPTW